MFTPCSPPFRNVLYILLEGNEKGVEGRWMGSTHFPHTIDNLRLGNIHCDNHRSPC
jgi:hypothetical protein